MIELYPDQMEILNEVKSRMRTHRNILMQSPTGSGKTAIATYMIQSTRNKNFTTVFTVPRKDLLEQTSETLGGLDIPHSYIAAGKQFNPYSKVYIGMIDSMARRLGKLPKANLLIVDETHFGDGALDSVISHYKKARTFIVGLSATPWKLSGKGLGCWYDTMVQGESISWLIENKRLSDYRYFWDLYT